MYWLQFNACSHGFSWIGWCDNRTVFTDPIHVNVNVNLGSQSILVPGAYDLSGLRQESRGSGSNHFRHAPQMHTTRDRMGRIRLFSLLFQNGCSQSSRFLPQAWRIVGAGDENAPKDFTRFKVHLYHTIYIKLIWSKIRQTAVINILNLHILIMTWRFVCTLHTFSKVTIGIVMVFTSVKLNGGFTIEKPNILRPSLKMTILLSICLI